jgi:hypothetical protein
MIEPKHDVETEKQILMKTVETVLKMYENVMHTVETVK